MVVFDAAVVVDMQKLYLERLAKQNTPQGESTNTAKYRISRMINNQQAVMKAAADANKPLLSIKYALAGDYDMRTENALRWYGAQHLAKDVCDVHSKHPKTNYQWKKHLEDYLEAVGAARVFLMGVTLEQCLADAADSMLRNGRKVLTAADVVDDPQYFPRSRKPELFDTRTTYLHSHKEALR